MDANKYWEQEGTRLLLDYQNRIPSVEERVKAAFNSGAKVAYKNLLQLEQEMERTRRDNFFSKHLKTNE